MKNQLSENYEMKIKDVVTTQIKHIYDGVEDPLGLTPHSREIEQRAESDDEIESEINHSRWLKDL